MKTNPSRRSRTSSKPAEKSRHIVEALEARIAPATFLVLNANDEGAGSLRQAVLDANSTANTGIEDIISFANIPATGAFVIHPLSPLPDITEAVIIDGYTAPGTQPNTSNIGTNAILRVEISGDALPGQGIGNGLVLGGSGGSTVRGLAIHDFRFGVNDSGSGILILSDFNTVAGNFLGTDASGAVDLGNGNAGVSVSSSFSVSTIIGNDIGGSALADHNLISGNTLGIAVQSRAVSTTIEGNLIGTNKTGLVALPNSSDGVRVIGSYAKIGGSEPGAGNVISGNGGVGIGVGSNSSTRIFGNFVGVTAAGTAALPNQKAGIRLDNNAFIVTVGGELPGEGNVISGNLGAGIEIGSSVGDGAADSVSVLGNRIGTDVTGSLKLGNQGAGIAVYGSNNSRIGEADLGPGATNLISYNGGAGISLLDSVGSTHVRISANSIHSNAKLGIDLRGGSEDFFGVTANDAPDDDDGANSLLNRPSVDGVLNSGTEVSIDVSLQAQSDRSYRIELFAVPLSQVDLSGSGEGPAFIGTFFVDTNSTGFGTTNIVVPGSFPANTSFTVVTIDDNTGDTSEFSNALGAPSTTYTWTGTQSSDWSEPLNWAPNGIPGPFDAAIYNGGTNPLVLDESVSVAVFRHGGSVLGGTGTLIAREDFEWTAGAHSGPNLLLLGTANLADATSPLQWTAGDLEVDGAAILGGQGLLFATGNLRVGSTGQLALTAGISDPDGAASPSLFTNFGEVSKSGAGNFGILLTSALNNGRIESNQGVLQLSGFEMTDGSLALNGGNISSTSALLLNGGALEGTGTVTASVDNQAGFVSPGGEGVVGLITIVGTYTQGSGGTLLADLGGTIAGTGYDQLTASGTTSLDGVLIVSLVPGFAAAPGNSFQVVSAEPRTGTFQFIVGAGLLTPSYTTNSASLVRSGNTFTWTGSVDSDWFTPQNWSPLGVPGPNDVAILNIASTINISDSNPTVGDFIQSAGSFTGAGSLTTLGSFQWSGGTQTGSGTTTTDFEASLIISGTATKNLDGRTIEVIGVGAWMGTGSTIFSNAGSIDDRGLLVISDDIGLQSGPGGGSVGVAGESALRKTSPGSLTFPDGIALSNDGLVDIQSGILSILGEGVASDGRFNTALGANLIFNSTLGYDFNGEILFSGAGTVSLTGGNLNGGEAELTFADESNFVFSGGVLTSGGGQLNINGSMTWEAGTIFGGGLISVRGSLDLSGPAAKIVSFRRITYEAGSTGTWSGTGDLSFDTDSFMTIGGFVEVEGDVDLVNGGGAGPFRVSSTGVLFKGGGGIMNFEMSVQNDGYIAAQVSSSLRFNNSFQQFGGLLEINEGADITSSSPIQILGGVVTGTGSIIANVENTAGIIDPGQDDEVGTLTIIGDYTQASDARLLIRLKTGGFSTLDVTGTATLDGAITTVFLGGFSPGVGEDYEVLTAGAVNGTFAVEDLPPSLSAQYNATSVQLISNALPPGVNGTTGDDTLVLLIQGGVAGYTLNGGPFTALPAGTSFTFNADEGNDTLIVDFTNGNPIPAPDGVFYNGQGENLPLDDQLIIIGGAQGTVTYNFTGRNSGSVAMANFGTVNFTGITPIVNSGGATDVIFYFPFSESNATLADDGTIANALSRLSGLTFPRTDFANPTGTLTINRGGFSDTLTVNALPDFNAGLTIGSEANPFAALTFAGAVTLGANKSLTASAFSAVSFSAAFTTSGSGNISLTAGNLVLGGGAGSISGSGALLLQPVSSSSTIGIGAGATGTFNLDATDLAALANGFSSITIGRAAPGSGSVDIRASIFQDDVSIFGDTIVVTGLNAGTNNVTLTTSAGPIQNGGDVSADVTGNIVVLVKRGSPTTADFFAIGGNGGSSAALSVDATTVSATSDRGSIAIDAVGTGGVSMSLLHTNNFGTGNIFAGSSTEDVTITAAQIIGTGLTSIQVTGHNLTASNLTSGGGIFAGDVTLATVTSGNVTIGAVTPVDGTVNVNSAGNVVIIGPINASTSGTWLASGSISGAGTVTFAGISNFDVTANGAINLSGVVTVPGTTTLAAGTANDITLTNAGNSFATINVASGATVSLRDEGGFNLGATNVSTLLSVQSAGAITQSGVLSGSGGLTKLGAGSLTFSLPNSYSGNTSIDGGELRLLTADVIPDGEGRGNVSVGTGATLDLNGFAETINGLGGTGTVISPSATAFTVGNNDATSSFAGTIAGSVALTKAGAGTLTLAGTNTYSGATTVSAGTLLVNGSLASGSAVKVAGIGTLGGTGTVNGSVTNAGTVQASSGTLTFGGAFANSGNVNALGGTLSFLGSFNQTGGTTTLGGGSISTSSVLTFSSGVLNGAGTITGNVNNTGAIVQPGGSDAAGRITITGGYTQGAAGTLAIDIGGLNSGTQYDQLVVSGAATLGGTLNVTSISGFIPTIGNSFSVISAGSRSGTFGTLNAGLLIANYTAAEVQLVRNVVTFTWDAGAGADTSWYNALNWSPDGVPTAGDSAILNTAATITLPSNVSIATFQQSNGTVTGGAGVSFAITSNFAWTGGLQNGAGNTVVGGTFTITNNVALDGRILITSAATTWSGGNITLGNNATILQGAGGTWTTNFDGSVVTGSGGGSFNNQGGTFTKTGGTGSTAFASGVTFFSAGAVNINSGTLSLGGGGSNNGTISVAAGARALFAGGSFQSATTAAFNLPAGAILEASGGLTSIDGPFLVAGTTKVSGGTLAINSNAGLANLDLSAGTLTGTSPLSTSGTFNWSGGSLTGGSIMLVNGPLSITNDVALTSRILNTLGATTWTGGTITISGNGRVDNGATGTWTTNFNGSILAGPAPGAPGPILQAPGFFVPFNNVGTFTKSGGGGATSFGPNIIFTNVGTLNANNSTINFSVPFVQISGSTVLGGGSLGGGATFSFQGGELSGAGTINGSVNNSGATVRPGGTGVAGTITIANDYTQGVGGTLAMDLGGIGAGQFDVLNVGGTATLGGTLNLANINGYTPLAGQTVRVVQSAGNPGSFATLTGSSLGFVQMPDATGLVLQATALTYVWDAGGGADTSWFNPLNWNFDSGFPSALDTAVLNTPATISLPSSVTVGSMQQTDGTVASGAGVTLTIANTFDWLGGFQSGTGTTLISAAANANLSGPGNRAIAGINFVNAGTVTWSGSGDINLNGGTIENQAGALFLILNGEELNDQDGPGTVGTFTNAGTVRKVTDTGTSLLQMFGLFSNAGTFAVQSGEVSIPTAFDNSGTVSAQGANFTLSGTGKHTGSFQANSGATITLAGTQTFNSPGSSLTAFPGASISIAGTATWLDGDFAGVTVALGATLTASGPASHTVFGAFVNNGTFNLAGSMQVINGAQISNAGLFDIQGDFGIIRTGGPAIIDNLASGILRKSAGTGIAQLNGTGSPITNAGTIEVLSGILQLNGGPVTSSGAIALGGGSLQGEIVLTGGELLGLGTIIGNVSNPGATVRPGGAGAAGTITITGTFSQSAAGTLESEIGGAGVGQFDVLAVGGAATFGGTLAGSYINGYSPAPSLTYTVFTYANQDGAFAALNPPAGLTANTSPTAVSFVSFAPPDPLVVNTMLDVVSDRDSFTSLREAILFANGNAGLDTITFAIAGNGIQTIVVGSALPAITDTVIIDGYSQPGATANQLSNGSNATLLIAIDGTEVSANADGLTLNGSSSTVRGLVIQNFTGNGIAITGSNNVIAGNFIGTDASGVTSASNGGNGISIVNGTGNTIGGLTPDVRNLIAFNGSDGVEVTGTGTGNRILGNILHSNTALGIDLGGDGATPNDTSDSDIGANDLINTPVLNAIIASGAGANVTGILEVSLNGPVRIEFFLSQGGQGRTLIGFTDVTATAGVETPFTFLLPGPLSIGDAIVATASDLSTGGSGTSEFSPVTLVAPTAITISDAVVVEGDNGTVQATFTLTLIQAVGTPVTVNFSTADFSSLAGNNATPGSDYVPVVNGVATFAPNQLTQTITITINGDTLAEARERFSVVLSNPTNAGLFDTEGTGVIQDDDHRQIAVGSANGNSFSVHSLSATGATVVGTVQAFDNLFDGGVRVAAGDVTGDGVDDFIAGAGLGGRGVVRVFDGTTLAPVPGKLGQFNAFATIYRGGVHVAAGDVNGDGFADVIVVPSAGSLNTVRVFSGADGSLLNSFQAFGKGTGGLRVATGDVNGDGIDEIIVGTGTGSNVRVFDATAGAVIPGSDYNFRALAKSYKGGIYVSAADINNDGLDDIIVGAAAGSAQVKIFPQGGTGSPDSFNAYKGALRGVRVAALDINGDGIAEIIAAKGSNSNGKITVSSGTTLAKLFDFSPFGKAKDGLFVG